MQNNENEKCKIILGIRLCQAANKKINMPQTFPTCGTGRDFFFSGGSFTSYHGNKHTLLLLLST